MMLWVAVIAAGLYSKAGLILTVLGTFFLALWALMRSDWRHVEARLIVTALFLCSVADYILGTGPFFAGMAAFLVV